MTRQKSQGTATLTFGLVSLPLDVVGMKRPGLSDETGFKQVCPTCLTVHVEDEDGNPTDAVLVTPVKQVNICPVDPKHGPFGRNEVAKARLLGEALYPVSPEQVAYVEEGNCPDGELDLHRVPRADLDAATYPSGYVYRLRPKKDAASTLGLIFKSVMAIADDPDTALLGQVKLRGLTRLYRFSTWQGQLLIQELIRPDQISVTLDDHSGIPVDERIAGQLEMVLTPEPFDPEAWHDEKAARTAELDEKLLAGEVFVAPATEAAVDIDPVAAAMALLGGGLADKPVKPKAKAKKPKALAEAAA